MTRAGAFLAALAMTGCGAVSGCGVLQSPKTDPKPQPPDLSRIITFVGADALAHGCPVAPNVAITARHVAVSHNDSLFSPAGPSAYAFSSGEVVGYARYLRESPSLDLAMMLLGNTVEPYPIAEGVSVGEVVWLVDFDRHSERPFQPIPVEAKVVTILPHHILLSDFGQPGSSGGCVLNAKGEVVGIYVAYIKLDDLKRVQLNIETVGMAVSVFPGEVAAWLKADEE